MQKKIPQRQCMGCRERKAKRELIRVVRTPEGTVNLDFGGKMNGRGAYICPQMDCLKKALKSKALDRSLEALHARLVIVAGDASDHTWRRAMSFVAGTKQQVLRVPFTKDQLGFAIGRQELAIAAFTDAALAASFVKALPQTEKTAQVLEALNEKARQVKQRQKEAKAHQKNVRMGKKK